MFTPQRPKTSGRGDVAQQEPKQARPATTPSVSGWVASVDRENKDYACFVEYFETQLEHAIRSSEHQGNPNGFRTSVGFELLDMIGRQFNRYDNLLRTIVRECEKSVYVNPDALRTQRGTPLKASDYFALQPYFVELHVQRTAQQAVDNDMHCTILLRAWRQAVVSEKQTAARKRLSTLTNNAGDCKESQLRLEGSIKQLRDDIANLKGSIESHTLTQDRLRLTFADCTTNTNNHLDTNQERQLQTLSNEWGRLCMALVDAEITYLSYMLAAVDLKDYCEPTMMLRPREDKLELLRAPEDVIVLRWASCMFHRHIQYNEDRGSGASKGTSSLNAATSDAEYSRVQNFTSDLKGMLVLGSILRVINRSVNQLPHAHSAVSDDSAKEWSPEQILHYLRVLRCPDYLVQHLEAHLDVRPNPSADIMYCVLSYLCCEYTCMVPAVCPWQEALQSLHDAKAAWDNVRKGWSELDTPFDVTKLDRFEPDSTHVTVVAMAKESLQNAVQMVQYAIETILHRARVGLPFQMMNRREARERAMYTNVSISKLSKILDVDASAEASKLEAILSDQYEDVQRIFKYYAASDVGDACSMSLDEFHRFLKDCKLLAKPLGLAYVKKIFNEINEVDESTALEEDAAENDDSEEVVCRDGGTHPSDASRGFLMQGELEFGPTEFVEAIVCVADKRLGTHKGLSLSQRVKKCLVEYVLANACRSSTDAFRHRMNTTECKTVFHTYQGKLEHIYRRYAAQSSSLNAHDFISLLEAHDLFTDVLTVADVKHVLFKIQQESDDASDAGAGAIPSQDLEALGAIALYLNPDIFVPIHSRVDDFMAKLVRVVDAGTKE
ncbi:hypothetical protein DYB32_004846 [Aphanomyces invadans]|uniref:EF-hand domain-containing protein n=1 Tax=Aphanomyces invadans TaxID=157072 RepID=A0A418AW44_9STRA|nr:hypothetical protein DYB32_004846 [Aphanomyces invadans]